MHCIEGFPQTIAVKTQELPRYFPRYEIHSILYKTLSSMYKHVLLDIL